MGATGGQAGGRAVAVPQRPTWGENEKRGVATTRLNGTNR